MSSEHKLGGDRTMTGLLPALVTLVTIALVWLFLGKEAAFLWTNLAFAVFAVLAGEQTVEEALQTAQQRAEQALR